MKTMEIETSALMSRWFLENLNGMEDCWEFAASRNSLWIDRDTSLVVRKNLQGNMNVKKEKCETPDREVCSKAVQAYVERRSG